MIMWGISSFGRAAALQAVGDQFDPGILHQESPLHTVYNVISSV